MPSELDFYHVKLAIAKGMFGYKAVTDEQFAKCHTAALNVFEALGTPAYVYDEKFMSKWLYCTYIEKGKPYDYRHQIRTALDMFTTGFCDELWCTSSLGLLHNNQDGYTVSVEGEAFETLDKDSAIEMFVQYLGDNYETLSRSS